MKSISAAFVLISAGILAASCTSERDAEGPSGVQLQGTSAEDAVERIATARCNYEQRCGNIGGTAEYKDRGHCMTTERQDRKGDLADCEYGVSKTDLSECLDEIQNQDCGGVGMAVDVLERSVQCTSGQLCLD